MKIWKKLKSENVLPTQNQIPNQSDAESQGDRLPWESFLSAKVKVQWEVYALGWYVLPSDLK